ncbi:MAG: hypothetical protein ACFCUJ_12580 [Thiotrichales bacterium]
MKKSLLSLSVMAALGLLATTPVWANTTNTDVITNTPTDTQTATNTNTETDADSASATGSQFGSGIANAVNGIAGGLNQGQAGAAGYQGDGTDAVDQSANANESVGTVDGASANNNSQSQNESQNIGALGIGNASDGSTADNNYIDDSGSDLVMGAGAIATATDHDAIDEKFKQSGVSTTNTDAQNVVGNDNDYIDTDQQAMGNGSANNDSTAAHEITTITTSESAAVVGNASGIASSLAVGNESDNDVNDIDGSNNQEGKGNARDGSIADNDGKDLDNVDNQTGHNNANHGAVADNDGLDQDNVGNNNYNGNGNNNGIGNNNFNNNHNTALNGYGNADRGGYGDNDMVDIEKLTIEAAVATSNLNGDITTIDNWVGGQATVPGLGTSVAGERFAYVGGNDISSGFSNVHGVTSIGQDVSVGSVTQQNVTVQSNMGF